MPSNVLAESGQTAAAESERPGDRPRTCVMTTTAMAIHKGGRGGKGKRGAWQ